MSFLLDSNPVVEMILESSSHPFFLGSFMTSLAVIGTVCYVLWVHRQWEKAFSGHRVGRTNEMCPSNKQLPPIDRFNETQATIVANSQRHEVFSKCELIQDVKSKQKNWRENALLRERAKRVSFRGIASANETAQELNMDHVYVQFGDFLWGWCFVGPMAILLKTKGT
eukprot:CAMPEP_0201235168 /NCGR_PEP_ID=MMETSP0852-20130820/6840_1 /ASSEMBLY_ACC=CAM_ASM_000632 /TAXON_ID=183588 /ORGANISM="Pseudo-nitzschia fraudulenta, Strain WWA7" /LENGTH=167 /DNA_ID=CAMNT_0047528703 /DNA_START=54 /DNA_END=553 /DNA_ORIENTATION=-